MILKILFIKWIIVYIYILIYMIDMNILYDMEIYIYVVMKLILYYDEVNEFDVWWLICLEWLLIYVYWYFLIYVMWYDFDIWLNCILNRFDNIYEYIYICFFVLWYIDLFLKWHFDRIFVFIIMILIILFNDIGIGIIYFWIFINYDW